MDTPNTMSLRRRHSANFQPEAKEMDIYLRDVLATPQPTESTPEVVSDHPSQPLPNQLEWQNSKQHIQANTIPLSQLENAKPSQPLLLHDRQESDVENARTSIDWPLPPTREWSRSELLQKRFSKTRPSAAILPNAPIGRRSSMIPRSKTSVFANQLGVDFKQVDSSSPQTPGQFDDSFQELPAMLHVREYNAVISHDSLSLGHETTDPTLHSTDLNHQLFERSSSPNSQSASTPELNHLSDSHSEGSPKSPQTQELDRSLRSADEALQELRASVRERPRSVFLPSEAIRRSAVATEHLLSRGRSGLLSPMLDSSFPKQESDSPALSEQSPDLRNWRIEYRRLRNRNLSLLSNHDDSSPQEKPPSSPSPSATSLKLASESEKEKRASQILDSTPLLDHDTFIPTSFSPDTPQQQSRIYQRKSILIDAPSTPQRQVRVSFPPSQGMLSSRMEDGPLQQMGDGVGLGLFGMDSEPQGPTHDTSFDARDAEVSIHDGSVKHQQQQQAKNNATTSNNNSNTNQNNKNDHPAEQDNNNNNNKDGNGDNKDGGNNGKSNSQGSKSSKGNNNNNNNNKPPPPSKNRNANKPDQNDHDDSQNDSGNDSWSDQGSAHPCNANGNNARAFMPRHYFYTEVGPDGRTATLPCPSPNSAASKTWVSGLAPVASPQITASPTLGGPVNPSDSPMLTQTPQLASVTNSPMVADSSSFASGADSAANGTNQYNEYAYGSGAHDHNGHNGSSSSSNSALMSGLIAGSVIGSVLLLAMLLWALFVRRKRNQRRKHLQNVLHSFGTENKDPSSSNRSSMGSIDMMEKHDTFFGSAAATELTPGTANYSRFGPAISSNHFPPRNSLSARNSSVYQPNVISPWLLYDGNGNPTISEDVRMSADLARSGLVSTVLTPQKDATFTWTHPTLSVPPAAARALTTGHYVKRRSLLSGKQRVPVPSLYRDGERRVSDATLGSVYGGQTNDSSPGLTGTESWNASGIATSEDDVLSSVVLHNQEPTETDHHGEATRTTTTSTNSTHDLSGSSHSNSNTLSIDAKQQRRSWISAMISGFPLKNFSTPPKNRSTSSDQIAPRSSEINISSPIPSMPPVQGILRTNSSDQSESSGEVRFANTQDPPSALVDVVTGLAQNRNSGSYGGSTSAAVVSRSGFPRVSVGWQSSLATCREDSKESLASAAAAAAAAAGTLQRLAIQPVEVEDSSEDELRRGYEAGEETDVEPQRKLDGLMIGGAVPPFRRQSLTQPIRDSIKLKPNPPSSFMTNTYLTAAAAAGGGGTTVHKRAPRLPPMLVPSITLTLDDDTFGIIERPLSLVSSGDSGSDTDEHARQVMRIERNHPTAFKTLVKEEDDSSFSFSSSSSSPSSRSEDLIIEMVSDLVPTTTSSKQQRYSHSSIEIFPKGYSITVNTPTRSSVMSCGRSIYSTSSISSSVRSGLSIEEDDDEELVFNHQHQQQRFSRQDEVKSRRPCSCPIIGGGGWSTTITEEEEDEEDDTEIDYGSDSAEDCLELSDFPTLPPWKPMTESVIPPPPPPHASSF